ncbi:MAG: protein kinase [Acidobacteria bacterium]|nr:protein kinase [Acidobacteriota bacterium]
MIGRSISHYRNLEKIGEGGMGVVYKAEDTNLDRVVALKFLSPRMLDDPQAKERFLREAKAAASLHHPNICTIYEVGEADGETFLAFAFLEGESLERRLADGPLPFEDALNIAQDVAAGLAAAHEKGVIHRDVKPANIMIGPDGRATIMDFGLALLGRASRLTTSEQVLGTTAYMAPEQTHGVSADARCDIWAFGCVLYEMLTGIQPFEAEYPQAILYRVVNEDPQPLSEILPDVSPELSAMVERALEKEPAARYQTALALASELEDLGRRLHIARHQAVAAPVRRPLRSSAGRLGDSAAPLPAQSSATSAVEGPVSNAPVSPARSWPKIFWFAAGMLAAILLVAGLWRGGGPAREHSLRWFTVVPESLSPTEQDGAVAVSPDGRYLVYVSGEQPPSLWVRSLSAPEPRKLAGTEGVRPGPFWSPDSRYLAFASGNDLKRIPVAGNEAPALICRLPGSFFVGGSWSDDGETVVFSSGWSAVGLYQAPSHGGEAVQIAPPEPGSFEVHPHLLPKHTDSLLLSAVRGDLWQVAVRNLRTGEVRTLVEGGKPVYDGSSRRILYQASLDRGGVWSAPFNLGSLETDGTPALVSERLRDASVSRDGLLVGVQAQDPPPQRLVLLDRHGAVLGSAGRPQALMYFPAFSPDGRSVAVSARDSLADGYDIWIHDVDGDGKRRLSFDEGRRAAPAWSPSGDRVAYSIRDGASLRVRDASGGGAASPLLASRNTAGDEGEADFSPREPLIVFRRSSGSGSDIWLHDARPGREASDRPLLATAANEEMPQISPDGSLLAYCSDETGRFEVYVRSFPEGEQRWRASDGGGCQPRWSRDGREVYYETTGALFAVNVARAPAVSLSAPVKLFARRNLDGTTWDYDVDARGRFVTLEADVDAEAAARRATIHIIENWEEGLL